MIFALRELVLDSTVSARASNKKSLVVERFRKLL